MKFQKGQSGNPGGRPKENQELKELARKHTKYAIERLRHWAESNEARASVAACTALLDRGHGKPTQAHEHGGKEDAPPIAITNEDRVKALALIFAEEGLKITK
jgi:hypothetical protein